MERLPKQGEFYKHFKNKMYQIVGIATHSETREPLVIYQALYGEFGIYARPLEMFVSEVDHVKYPEVKQKWRFERVDAAGNSLETAEEVVRVDAVNAEVINIQTANIEASGSMAKVENAEEGVNAKLLEFLDAESFDEKYNVLVSMRDEITDKLIDDIAVAIDVVIPDGELTKRYDDLKYAIRTRQHYEFANRLR